MLRIFKVIIIFVVILFCLHIHKFKKYNTSYEIQQQELDYIDGNNLYNQLSPLIITFIEDTTFKNNINSYELYSSMSFNKKHNLYNTGKEYIAHSKEFLLLRPKGEIVVELINPKFKNLFSRKGKDHLFQKFTLQEKNYKKVKSIDIIVREYNILVIPRQWLFKINDKSVEIFTADNIFTYLFGKF